MADEKELFQLLWARQRACEIRTFCAHTVLFLIIAGGVTGVNFALAPDTLWFQWVVSLWGVVWLGHVLVFVGVFGLLGRGWEDKKIKALVKKEKRRLKKVAKKKAAKEKAAAEKQAEEGDKEAPEAD